MWPCYLHSSPTERGSTTLRQTILHFEAYKKIYEQPLIPLDLTNVNGDVIHSPPGSTVVSDDEESQSQEDDPDVLPPSTRRAPGRPRKRRIRSQHEVDGPKCVFTCTRCKGTGHSKRTCRAGLNTPA